MENIALLRSRIVDGCDYCKMFADKPSAMFPSHRASEQCESGKKNHCTCDACF